VEEVKVPKTKTKKATKAKKVVTPKKKAKGKKSTPEKEKVNKNLDFVKLIRNIIAKFTNRLEGAGGQGLTGDQSGDTREGDTNRCFLHNPTDGTNPTNPNYFISRRSKPRRQRRQQRKS
jgi:hypothetical protein